MADLRGFTAETYTYDAQTSELVGKTVFVDVDSEECPGEHESVYGESLASCDEVETCTLCTDDARDDLPLCD